MFGQEEIERKRKIVLEISDNLRYIQDTVNRTRESVGAFPIQELRELSSYVSDLRYRTSQVDFKVSVFKGELTEIKGSQE
jgi:hypothetical protein